MNRITTEMCENGYGRAGFARVLIEIEASSGLVDNVAVCYKSLGKSMELKVEYPWKPPICAHCKVFGHAFERCSKRPINDAEKVIRDEVNATKQVNDVKSNSSGNEWQYVNYRRFPGNDGVSNGYGEQRFFVGESSNSRGGYSGRSRGGMQGRGSGNQRFNRYAQAQYAPVKKTSEVKNESGKVSSQSNNGKGIMRGDGSAKGNEAVAKSANKYASLADDSEMEKNLEWEAMKDRINEVCSKGLVIGMEEKKNWPSELKEYYKKKMEKFVKNGNAELLKAKIKNFEKSIKHCSESIVMTAKRKTDSIDKSGLLAQGFGTRMEMYSTVMVLIALGRDTVVFPLSILSNYMRRSDGESSNISGHHQMVIWWAGLMRGVVSIALAFKQIASIEGLDEKFLRQAFTMAETKIASVESLDEKFVMQAFTMAETKVCSY
ncbi:cation/H+ exchanger, Cation/H+ exchanger, CPA1 family [Artemisia annua]|uniref:Cation/H+ exchanger, Cation/H+ exchanger, CPA1 family n=1 Tax=Artemisia annua TaxID=35608 RepID=A0A2U1N9U1_ARTAN|nr:cation/H+ exchanger, Cation/H+ exchanger, CPA1 family [Artemisia annua]